MSKQKVKFSEDYQSFMRGVAVRVWCRGTQKECAEFLGISPSNLSRILTCTVACQSTLFFKLLAYVDIGFSYKSLDYHAE